MECVYLINMSTLEPRQARLPVPIDESGSMSLGDLQECGAELVRALDHLEKTSTDILRDLAAVVVGARSQFFTSEGLPDWSGKTWEYRVFIRKMYASAGVPPDSESKIQNSVRYHVRKLVRQVAPERERLASGLSTDVQLAKKPVDSASLLKSFERRLSTLNREGAISEIEQALSVLQSIRDQLIEAEA